MSGTKYKITGGSLDSGGATGTINHSGSLRLSAGATKLTLSAFTVKLAKKRCRFYEVPISYHGRTYEEGKKITWKDGIAALY